MKVSEIKVGDEVVWLYAGHLINAKCLKVNKTTYKLEGNFYGKPCIKNVPKEKVANKLDKFTMVVDYSKGVNGDGVCRIDYTTYLSENSYYTRWYQPHTYIIER